MKQLKILLIFGTRPEAIKIAPIVKKLLAFPGRVKVYVCVTGQHREMLDQVLNLFGICPDYDFNLMQDNQTPNQVAANVLLELDPLMNKLRPDWVLVQGDTTTVMAAAIAAHYHRVRVGHVEAGLRTYDRENPFPEEMNRVVTDHVSDLHFAPTSISRDNLVHEGISVKNVFITGNTVIDALRWIANQPPPPTIENIFSNCEEDYDQIGRPVDLKSEERWNSTKSLILVTAHRRENFGKPLLDICQALRSLAARRDVHIIYPVHRNPNVWEPVHELLVGIPGITLLAPVDYLTLVHLLKSCHLVLTDSGGIQEEAPSLNIPVLVLRETTERPEAVSCGAARIVGTDPERIIDEVENLLDDHNAHSIMAQAKNPYGDGKASERIVDVLLRGQCREYLPQDL